MLNFFLLLVSFLVISVLFLKFSHFLTGSNLFSFIFAIAFVFRFS